MDEDPTQHDVPREAAFFDLDKTIIATSSATAFSRPFLAQGLLTRRSVLRTAYAQLLYLVGGADEDQTERLRAQLSRMVAGWDVSLVSSIVAETLHESIDPTVYAEAVALIEAHHAAGRDVVVVSASGAEVVEPIAAILGCRPRHRDPDERGRRPVHGRDRLLRVRGEQGVGHPGPRPGRDEPRMVATPSRLHAVIVAGFMAAAGIRVGGGCA